jgi:hypothetical protein
MHGGALSGSSCNLRGNIGTSLRFFATRDFSRAFWLASWRGDSTMRRALIRDESVARACKPLRERQRHSSLPKRHPEALWTNHKDDALRGHLGSCPRGDKWILRIELGFREGRGESDTRPKKTQNGSSDL